MPTRSNGRANRLDVSDRRFHDWYRFVLSFPPHLVREYLQRFGLSSGQTLLDPFCGTGTTLIVAKANGLRAVGVEANPMAHFASQVKTNWSVDPVKLIAHAENVADEALNRIRISSTNTLRSLSPDSMRVLLTDSISPLPLHKSLLLLDAIQEYSISDFTDIEKLAFAKIVVQTASNLHFGPEVGVRREKKTDAPVVEAWLKEVRTMAEDLYLVGDLDFPARIILADSRDLSALLEPNSIDAVFTSPPYPNEKDYTRTTRLESVLLGFFHDRAELQALKKSLLRSNTRNVYRNDNDDRWIEENDEIQRIAVEIERKRIAMGKDSGFERLYSRVTKLYFGGMARHLSELRNCLKPGAYLGYVVGDQASYLQVMIKTGSILADLATSLGYQVESIDLFRSRFASATKQQIREEVVVLRWMGGNNEG